MNWIEELQKAGQRAWDLSSELNRRVSLVLTFSGLSVVVGDPAKRLHTESLDFNQLHEQNQAGTLPDTIELLARHCAKQLDEAGA